MSASAAAAWRAQRTEDGSWTLLHPVHGEACHSLAGAWTQARERYASVIADLEPEVVASGVMRLCDVGTGTGLNLAAAIEACEARGLALDAHSFEIDPAVCTATLELMRTVEPCSPAHARVLEILESQLGIGAAPRTPPGVGGHRIELHFGDARELLPQLAEPLRFDAVFLDPFSPRVDPPLWEEPFLAEIARRMDRGARLSTYTSSLRVRAGLARAGLNVGLGPRVGRKASGTLAARDGDVPPLDPRTSRKLARARSGACSA